MQSQGAVTGVSAIVDFDRVDHTSADLGHELGGKGWGLAQMCKLGLPVPPGFTITTTACGQILDCGSLDAISGPLRAAVARLEERSGRRLGDVERPLLVSVRSGAPSSMPGMMDTVLNIGLVPDVAVGLARATGDESFAWDAYRRLAEMYVSCVLGSAVDVHEATQAIAANHTTLPDRLVALDSWLDAHDVAVPQDPWLQLEAAVDAVVRSWHSDRACAYRRRESIPDRPCTAVNVQAMVFGNLGATSGSGVVFTRDPSTGGAGLVGDYLSCAQGEDVVAGTHVVGSLDELAASQPMVFAELHRVATELERHYVDMCDIEFTVERGRLWVLQVRIGKRSPQAALRIAIDLAQDEGYPFSREDAVRRTAGIMAAPPRSGGPLHDVVDTDLLYRGVAASPGVASGRACFTADAVLECVAAGDPAVLVRPTTDPSDVHGMVEAAAIVTATGGMMSHAAVLARAWGVPAVVAVGALVPTDSGGTLGGLRVGPGEWMSVDGSDGVVCLGRFATSSDEVPEAGVLREWATATTHDDASHGSAPAPQHDLAQVALLMLAIRRMVSANELALIASCETETADALLGRLEKEGLAQPAARGHRLTEEGTAHAMSLWAEHHDRLAMSETPASLLDEFDAVNLALKATLTAWQIRSVDGADVPNDHQDAAYDAAVLDRLAGVHAEVDAWIDRRGHVWLLEYFRSRLARAVGRVREGDHAWLTSPRVDSYHSVWFELHEHLIRLAGRTRAEEAIAGRAH
jgi:pyruvate,orthophosphate dikinase